MVLFKRKNVTIPETKLIPAEDDQEVWVIPETEEIFCTYDDYLARLDFYMQKKFICELSGASCLTYFEALKKENQEKKQVLKFFPEPLKEPILRMVQFSLTTRLDQLVDEVHIAIKAKFFVGENVYVRFQDQKIRADVVKADHESGIYQVDDGLRVLEGDYSQLQRDRKLLSKPALRAFVKHSAYREPWLGSPWILKESVASKYGISSEVPQNILDLKAKNGHITANSMNINGESKGSRSSTNSTSSAHVKLAPKHASAKSSTSGTPSYKQLNQNYLEARSQALKQLEDQIPLELRNDDLFDLAKSDEPLTSVISRRNDIKPWPEWHKDSSLDTIEDAHKINHLLEVWLFSHYFSELIGFTDNLQKFDDFVSGILKPEPSAELSKLHECLLSMLVAKNGKKLAIPLPEESESSDEESSSDEEGNEKDENKKRGDQEDDEVGDDNEEEEDADDEKEEEYNSDSENGPPRKKYKKSDSSKIGKIENPWVMQIGKRDYKNGGWQYILIEILQKLVHSSEWHPDTCLVVAHFTGDANTYHEVSNSDASKAYSSLPAPLRIHALMLIARLIYGSDQMRDFLDSQYDTASKIRRQAHNKELKQYREEHKSAQKLLNMTIDHAHDSSSVSIDQMKQLAVELNLEESFTPEEVKDLMSDLSDKIEKTVGVLNETSKTLARMDNQRMRLLGKDRFFNRYWWMDSNGVDQSGNLYMGRLWVQGPSDVDKEYLKSEFFSKWFIDFRRDVLNETARIKHQAAQLVSQQTKASSAEKEAKVSSRKERALKPRPAQNETNASSKIKFINQVGSKPPAVRRAGPVENPNRILTDLGNLERRLRELIQVSKHNGDLLCADDTIELRQLESELLESRKNLADSPTEVVQRNIKKVVKLFSENFPASQFGREAYMNQPDSKSVAEASATSVDNTSTSNQSLSEPQQQPTQQLNTQQSIQQQPTQQQAPLMKTKFKMVNPTGGKPPQQSGMTTAVHTQTKFIDGTPKNVPSTVPSVQTVYNPPEPVLPSVAPQSATPSVPSSVPPGVPAQATPGSQPPLMYDPYRGVYTNYQPGYQMNPSQHQQQQQPVQWVVQQTSQGPMMYAVPIQQYQQMVMPQYAPPMNESGDAYNAYIQQQIGMQQAYYAQQMQQYQGYYQQGQYGSPVVSMGYSPAPDYGQLPGYGPPPPPGYNQTVPTPQASVQPPTPLPPLAPQPGAPGNGVTTVTNQGETSKSAQKAEIVDLGESDSDAEHKKAVTSLPTNDIDAEKGGEKIPVKPEVDHVSKGKPTSAQPEVDSNRANTVEAESEKSEPAITETVKTESVEAEQLDDSDSIVEKSEYIIREDPVRPAELVSMQTNGPLASNEWRFYETPEELDQLLSYLGNSGKREVKLGSALRKVYPEMRALMTRRLKDLEDPMRREI